MINLKISVPSVSLTYDKKQTKAVMRAAASEVANVARRLIRNGSVKSKPGSPPSSQTGKLAASIRSSVKQRGNAIIAKIADVEFYAKFLETGAKGPGKRVMQPRPFLSTALESRKDSIADRIRDALDKGIKFEKQK